MLCSMIAHFRVNFSTLFYNARQSGCEANSGRNYKFSLTYFAYRLDSLLLYRQLGGRAKKKIKSCEAIGVLSSQESTTLAMAARDYSLHPVRNLARNLTNATFTSRLVNNVYVHGKQ